MEAQRTNPRGRTKRIIRQLETGIKGDYRNAREMRADNKVLVEQRFGNRKQREADIRAAFGMYG
nr:MAG TPA: hypothetical protein [Bacteriophage sp.]